MTLFHSLPKAALIAGTAFPASADNSGRFHSLPKAALIAGAKTASGDPWGVVSFAAKSGAHCGYKLAGAGDAPDRFIRCQKRRSLREPRIRIRSTVQKVSFAAKSGAHCGNVVASDFTRAMRFHSLPKAALIAGRALGGHTHTLMCFIRCQKRRSFLPSKQLLDTAFENLGEVQKFKVTNPPHTAFDLRNRVAVDVPADTLASPSQSRLREICRHS